MDGGIELQVVGVLLSHQCDLFVNQLARDFWHAVYGKGYPLGESISYATGIYTEFSLY